MKTAVIVKNASQVAHALRRGGPAWLFLCTNEAAERECAARNLEWARVSEEPIASEWAAIDTWAYGRAAELLSRLEARPEERFFIDANHMNVKALFVHVLKSVLIFDSLIAERGIGRIVSPDEENSVLALILRSYLPRFRRAGSYM